MDKNIDYGRLGMVQNLLDEFVATKQNAGCSCLVIKDGKELGYFEAGLRDIGKGLPITRDTIFRIFSMSKVITSVAVMQLMENGKIDILDPVSKYIPEFKDQKCYENGVIVPVKDEMRIKNLLDMTSGLCYPGEVYEAEVDTARFMEEIADRIHAGEKISTHDFVKELSKLPLAFEPGTRWNYGLSADVLGVIIEIVSGMPLAEYLKKNIFEPLEMHDTGFFVPEEKQERFARTYIVGGEELEEFTGEFLLIKSRMECMPDFVSGGAGLTSTIDDYSKITMMLLNKGEYNGKKILHPQTVKFMSAGSLTEKQREGMRSWESLKGHTYGNLVRVMRYPGEHGGCGSVGEFGWDGWTGVYMAVIPEHNMCIHFMTQKYESGTIDVTRKLRNVIFSSLK